MRASVTCLLFTCLLFPLVWACGSRATAGAAPVVEIARPPNTAPAPPPASAPEGVPLERFVGIFVGTLESSGEEVPVSTELGIRNDQLNGRYAFGEFEPEIGTLYPCEASENVVTCTWSDSYGEGPLLMRFDRFGNAFRGTWATQDEPDMRFPWNGRRSADEIAALTNRVTHP